MSLQGDALFEPQQESLSLEPARVACQRAVCAHDPVARDEQGDGVMSHCPAHCLPLVISR